jgi:hypothetical protein
LLLYCAPKDRGESFFWPPLTKKLKRTVGDSALSVYATLGHTTVKKPYYSLTFCLFKIKRKKYEIEKKQKLT